MSDDLGSLRGALPSLRIEFAYIGRAECGCVVAAVADVPSMRDVTAEGVADFINSGLTVERVPAAQGRLSGCTCTAKASAATHATSPQAEAHQ